MPRSESHPLPQPLFHEPVFGDGHVTADPTGFIQEHASDKALYQEVENLLKTAVVGFDQSRIGPDQLYRLGDAFGQRGADVVKEIEKAGRIVFHALGDSGATTDGKQYGHELSVTDQLTMDCNITETANRPSFLLHLGDVVYDFGESQYYYDQFYAPFRDYPAPIFAIPGNHDSFVIPDTPAGETPLEIFTRNFCADSPVVTREAASLHRTAMTQPGVYYALEAPFVRILCLFSNALEDPGVISSEHNRWQDVPDHQLDFLEAQLEKIKTEHYAGAVLIAVHHPPFSYAAKTSARGPGGSHGCSTAMLRQIDTLCAKIGVYPHAFLSAHAHNYQRYHADRPPQRQGSRRSVHRVRRRRPSRQRHRARPARQHRPRNRISAAMSAISTSSPRSRPRGCCSKSTTTAATAICASASTRISSASASIWSVRPPLRNRASTR